MNFVYAIFGLVALVVPLFFAALLFHRKSRKVGAGLVSIYVVTYCFLSYRGQYVEYIGGTSDGNRSWYAWGCVNTRASPGTGRVKTGMSEFGSLFWPLILMDQSLIHATLPCAA